MRAFGRMLLLLLVALGPVLPMASGLGAPARAEAATPPCSSQRVLKACVAEMPTVALAPRGTASIDAPCLAKAIRTEGLVLSAPTNCTPLAFDVASSSWSAWAPPTLVPPPRS